MTQECGIKTQARIIKVYSTNPTLSWSQGVKGADSEMLVVVYLLRARIPSGPRPPFESVAV